MVASKHNCIFVAQKNILRVILMGEQWVPPYKTEFTPDIAIDGLDFPGGMIYCQYYNNCEFI